MYKIFTELSESKLIRNKNFIKSYSSRDAADLLFLYTMVLHVFASDFDYSDIASGYAKKTIAFNNFNTFRMSGSDMYMLAYMIQNRDDIEFDNPGSSSLLNDKISFNQQFFKKYLLAIKSGNVDQGWVKQYLYKLQKELAIDDGNYRSVRRLVGDWKSLSTQQKKLVITRLLQAFRVRARRAELFNDLEKFAKKGNYEIPKDEVINPELPNGEPRSLGSKVAGALTGAAAGAIAGYKLGRRRPKELRGKIDRSKHKKW